VDDLAAGPGTQFRIIFQIHPIQGVSDMTEISKLQDASNAIGLVAKIQKETKIGGRQSSHGAIVEGDVTRDLTLFNTSSWTQNSKLPGW